MNQSSRNNSSSDMHPLDLLRKLKTKRDDDDDFIGKAISISMNPDGDMKINGEKPPEELLDILNKISEKLKNAFEEDAGKSMNEMSTEELNEKLDEAIKKEDYNRASLIRDEISKRNSDDENKSS
jgi:KaiC/GvpD/RAD55 family RecA-like ATPase